MTDFSKNWANLSGNNLWGDLKEPIPDKGPHIDLRRYIIHYGERAGAIDDLVIDGKLVSPTKSNYVGRPRYIRRDFFDSVGLVKGNPYTYEVKKYVYGALPNRTSNLLAYVAVSTDAGSVPLGRRDILIAWRGTKLDSEAAVDTVDKLAPAPKIFNDAAIMVHAGWYAYYTNFDRRSLKNVTESCRDQVSKAVKELMDQYGDESPKLTITVTGRGTGAALAALNVVDLVYQRINETKKQEECLVTGIVFGCPRVGNEAFQKLYDDQKMTQILRVANELDPMIKFPEKNLDYKHVGVELKINTTISNDLKKDDPKKSKDDAKELEVYLHGVAGQKGIKNPNFEWQGVRDIVMVNKTLDSVDNNKHKVPAKWFLHRFMKQDDNGTWELKDDFKEDDA